METPRPHWDDESLTTIPPNPKACETCLFRPSAFRGHKLDRADTACCTIFEEPEEKPHDVYWDGADCEFYEDAKAE